MVHSRRRGRRGNPAGYRWGDLFVLGAGGLVGGALPSAGTQLILGASNTGMVGYAVNLVTTLLTAWVGAMFVRNRAFPAGILAGGVGSLMRRIISDYSLFGGYTASIGMGDYMVVNWVTPQRLASDFRSLTDALVDQGHWGYEGVPPSLPARAVGPLTSSMYPTISSSGVSARGMSLEGDPGYGGAFGNG